VQYLFKDKEHVVDADVPHGNSKKDRGYKRVMASTRKALQTQHPSSKKSAKEILDAVYLDLRPINAWLLLALPTLDLICPRELRARLNISSVLPFECILAFE
jgi:hypothetical protein